MRYSYNSTDFDDAPLFFFNDTATTEIYTLSLHDALPICEVHPCAVATPTRRSSATIPLGVCSFPRGIRWSSSSAEAETDRKSTRLNSSHANISYAVFCLKKKKYNAKFAA